MILTSIDYQNIANMIEAGCNSIEYYNGTGAYVVTTRFLSVEAADSFNKNGEATTNDFCEGQLLTMVA